MNKITKIRAMGIPYWNFREKIRITKKFEKYYHIEDFGRDGLTGILYMERKKGVIV
jgi:hypothetical protein